jgi:predicted Zn-dependent peptidase
MKIISFIEDEEVIKKILKHFGLWEVKARPPPKVKAPP